MLSSAISGRLRSQQDSPRNEPQREGHERDEQVVFRPELVVVVDPRSVDEDVLDENRTEDERERLRVLGGCLGYPNPGRRGQRRGDTQQRGQRSYADRADVFAPVADRFGRHGWMSAGGAEKAFGLGFSRVYSSGAFSVEINSNFVIYE